MATRIDNNQRVYNTDCPICLDHIPESMQKTLEKCHHAFHINCIESWENMGNNTCPICRQNITNNKLKNDIDLRAYQIFQELNYPPNPMNEFFPITSENILSYNIHIIEEQPEQINRINTGIPLRLMAPFERKSVPVSAGVFIYLGAWGIKKILKYNEIGLKGIFGLWCSFCSILSGIIFIFLDPKQDL